MDQKTLSALSLSMLKVLCKAQGCSTNGSKDELIDRLVTRGQRRPASSRERKQGFATPGFATPGLATPGDGEGAAPAAKRRKVGPTAAAAASAVVPKLPANFACPLPRADGGAAVSGFRLLRCRHCLDLTSLQRARYRLGPENFWCPRCRFEAMDPFHEVNKATGTLYSALVSGSPMQFCIDLPELDVWRKAGEVIDVRMICVDSDMITHVWPEVFVFEANGKDIFRIDPPEKGHPRRDVPRNIIDELVPGTNYITVRISHTGEALLTDFALTLMRATPRSVRRLCASVGRCEESVGRGRLQAILAKERGGGEESEGVQLMSSGALRLECPITMDRLDIPARGLRCKHLRCFGLWAYFKSNHGMSAFNKRWTCPVCGDSLRPKDLCIDGYVEGILAATRELDADEVTVAPDGSWEQARRL